MERLNNYCNKNINEGLLSFIKNFFRFLLGVDNIKYKPYNSTNKTSSLIDNHSNTYKINWDNTEIIEIPTFKEFKHILGLNGGNLFNNWVSIMKLPEFKCFGKDPWNTKAFLLKNKSNDKENIQILGIGIYSMKNPFLDEDKQGIMLLDYELIEICKNDFNETNLEDKIIDFLINQAKENNLSEIQIAINNNKDSETDETNYKHIISKGFDKAQMNTIMPDWERRSNKEEGLIYYFKKI